MGKLIPWLRPSIGSDDADAVSRVMKSGWITQGSEVEALEKQICDYIGCKHAVAVSNGTMAVMLAILAAKQEFFEDLPVVVIVPATSFIATASPASLMGMQVVCVDIGRDMQIDSDQVNHAVSQLHASNNVIIVNTHLAGRYSDLRLDSYYCSHYRVRVIDDACQALGVIHNKKHVGSSGRMTAFSFHAGKIITCGEGGCVVTNKDSVAQDLRSLRNHGLSKDYMVDRLGTNARMTDIHAAIARQQLSRIEGFITYREVLSDIYDAFFYKTLRDRFRVMTPSVVSDNNRYVRSFYAVEFGSSQCKKIQKYLRDKNIDARRFFPPMIDHTVLGCKAWARLPNAIKYRKSVLMLPLGNGITLSEVLSVIKALKSYFNSCGGSRGKHVRVRKKTKRRS